MRRKHYTSRGTRCCVPASTIKRRPVSIRSVPGTPVQLKCTGCEKDNNVQKKTNGKRSIASSVQASIWNSTGKGQPLPQHTRLFMENRMGTDFSSVNIHDDTNAYQLNRQLGAQAFTLGNDVYFGEGKYAPETTFGKHLLAHELTHVLQQKGENKTVQRLVNPAKVSCERYPRSYPIFASIGTQDPTGILQGTDLRAIGLLTTTIDELSFVRDRIAAGAVAGWPTFSDCMGQSLRERLLVDPANATSWTNDGPNTVKRLIRMYTNLRKVFQGGQVHYSCLGADCGPGYDAYVFLGQQGYRIHLCHGFWQTGLDDRAMTLVHEMAHLYYNTEDWGFVGMGSSYCLEQFLADMNHISVPAPYRGACHSDRVTRC